jgi:MFS family permease
MAAAVSLGMTRFAYALLLPPMREDLSWSYTLAGAMNTFNAVGYLVGALVTPWALRRVGAIAVLIWGSVVAATLMAVAGFLTDNTGLLVQRFLAGIASATVFVSGGLLAARLGANRPAQSGLLLGLYYGGTGWGIVLSALMVPVAIAWAHAAAWSHAWAWAWWLLACLCFTMVVLLLLIRPQLVQWAPEIQSSVDDVKAGATATMNADKLANQNAKVNTKVDAKVDAPKNLQTWRQWSAGLLGYGLFGVGYIGYMTFVVALLREQGVDAGNITFFYALLGLAVVLSSRIWAGLLNHFRGGQALALLNGLLAIATVIPAISAAWPMMLVSGVLFGGVFLSVVASTTAMVKHNLPPAEWAAGISAFTVIFAIGQIVGPTMVGWIADGPGGLQRGLVFSAAALMLGAIVAWQQKPLSPLKS